VPSLIETRPFTIHPELYAWPSFRIFSERAVWIYLLMVVVLSVLLAVGMSMGVVMAILLALALVLVAFGLSFMKYRSFLRKPENRRIFSNCVVSLEGDQLRQDFSDGSYVAIQFFAIETFRESGDFYFIFAKRPHGIVVPKTAFESPEESQEFASRIREVVRRK
jgi:hypothetical protein